MVWLKKFLISWSGLETKPTIASLDYMLFQRAPQKSEGCCLGSHISSFISAHFSIPVLSAHIFISDVLCLTFHAQPQFRR